MELSITLALALGLLVLGLWLPRQSRKRHREVISAMESATLRRSLDLLQALQRHRGLGAQLDDTSRELRHEQARMLDQLWLDWPDDSLQLPPLHQDWPQLRRKPADFSAHCRMIEGLLAVIEQLEDRLCLREYLGLRGLGQACRALEDLARLRGLSIRAANYPRCPVGLKMQIRFLCQRLHSPDNGEPLQNLLARLEHELIDTAQISLTPHDCFALFTPLIDEHLQVLRHTLSQAIAND